jgi:hypothetical protein
MSYIGKEPQLQGSYDKADDISSQFDGTLVKFDIKVNTVLRPVGKETNMIVSLNGALQEPGVDYTIEPQSGGNPWDDKNVINFAVAPASGTKCSITILGDVFKAPTTGNTDLNSLTDVAVGSPVNDQILKYQGGTWVNGDQGSSVISGNDDVDTSGASAGNKLVFDVSGKWTPEDDVLGNIDDVDSTIPTNNEVLTYDASISKWKPSPPASTVNVLNDLSNVNESSASSNQVLTYNGSDWIPADTQRTVDVLNDLSNVDAPTPSDGQSLVWNATSGKWSPATVSGGSGGASAINDLTDVDTATVAPTNGQYLSWDSTKSQWIPRTASGGGGSLALNDLTDVDTVSNPPGINQVLGYDGSGWTPITQSGGGGASISTIDISVYVDSVNGNDSTGSGEITSPVQTISKAFEIGYNSITGNGDVIIYLKQNTVNTIDTTVNLNHPNKFIIKSDNGAGTTKATIKSIATFANPLFKIDNSFLEFEDINYDTYTSVVDSQNKGSVKFINCVGSVEKIVTDDSSLSDIIFFGTILSASGTTTIENCNNIEGDVIINVNNDIVAMILKNCFSNKFNFAGSRNDNSGWRNLLELYHTNMNEFSLELTDEFAGNSLDSGLILYVNESSINKLIVDTNSYSQHSVKINESSINRFDYINDTEFVPNTGGPGGGRSRKGGGGGTVIPPLLDLSGTSINYLYMNRTEYNNEFGYDKPIITAKSGSSVFVSLIFNYGDSLRTTPDYIYSDGNLSIDNMCSYIYINEIEGNTGCNESNGCYRTFQLATDNQESRDVPINHQDDNVSASCCSGGGNCYHAVKYDTSGLSNCEITFMYDDSVNTAYDSSENVIQDGDMFYASGGTDLFVFKGCEIDVSLTFDWDESSGSSSGGGGGGSSSGGGGGK